ncbi:MAG TPA: flagellar basal body P-ring formation chaperone FlgA [Steroidobacteraceae bacterium]|nr:flagellar basal body P-ring formation chaperone FlgA [Steroidobacteraceae bacterium]
MPQPSKTRQRVVCRGLERERAQQRARALQWLAGLVLSGAMAAPSHALESAAPAADQPMSGSATEAVSTLEALARTRAVAELPPLGAHQRLALGALDARFAPPRCLAPIEPVAGPGGHPRDRVTIELRCATPRWHLYVPVRVLGTSTVLLAAHAIVAGTVLAEGDFRVEERDVQELPPGYMDEPKTALGLAAGRPIASGAIITNQMLLGSRVVQRGQSVTLVADAGGLSVRMAGRALTDGLVNQRVRVQNLSSGKVVEGIARSDQVVEIISQ